MIKKIIVLCTGVFLKTFRSQYNDIYWYINKRARLDLSIDSILQSPDSGMPCAAGKIFSQKSSIAYHSDIVVKRYNSRKPSDLILDLFRPSKASFAFRKALLLEEIGLPVAQALAQGSGKRRGLYKPSYFVMRRVQNAKTYNEFFKSGGDHDRARLIGIMIGRLHAHGLRHRDLRSENLLEDGNGKLWFIDMEGIRIQLWPTPNRILRDLRPLYKNFLKINVKPNAGVISAFWRCYLSEQPKIKRKSFIADRKLLFSKK